MQGGFRNKLLAVLWPSADEDEGARRAAFQGVFAAGFSAAVALVAAVAAVLGRGFWGANLSNFIDAGIFALIAWRIRRMSRVAALVGSALYLIGRLSVSLKSPAASIALAPFEAVFALMYVNSIRGTFAYRRRHATSFSPDDRHWSRSAPWKTAAAMVLAVGAIGLLIALAHPRNPIL